MQILYHKIVQLQCTDGTLLEKTNGNLFGITILSQLFFCQKSMGLKCFLILRSNICLITKELNQNPYSVPILRSHTY